MTEEPTDADGAPTATARRDATHNAKSTRHLAHSHAGKMALDWPLAGLALCNCALVAPAGRPVPS
jgi:hypothetical protein